METMEKLVAPASANQDRVINYLFAVLSKISLLYVILSYYMLTSWRHWRVRISTSQIDAFADGRSWFWFPVRLLRLFDSKSTIFGRLSTLFSYVHIVGWIDATKSVSY